MSLPEPDAQFYWRNCIINMRKAAERYGPIDVIDVEDEPRNLLEGHT